MYELFQLIYSKEAVVFYLFILITERLTKYALSVNRIKGNSTMLRLADTLGLIAIIYLVYICYIKFWWSFIPLMFAYIIIYVILKALLKIYVVSLQKFRSRPFSLTILSHRKG